jgi:hypothetical protein
VNVLEYAAVDAESNASVGGLITNSRWNVRAPAARVIVPGVYENPAKSTEAVAPV